MEFLHADNLFEIFKFLEPDKNLPLVCKKFNFVYKKDILWDVYLFRDYKIQDENPKETYIEYYKFYNIQKWLEKCDKKYTFDESKHLKKLQLWSSNIENLPKGIGNLKNLEELYLSDNKLKDLPKEIGKLTKLKILHLDSNKLKSLPKEIGNLKNLEILNLFNNKLESLPIEIGNLKNLKKLNLSFNKLESLPIEIENLIKYRNT